jgi:hypothetical protein
VTPAFIYSLFFSGSTGIMEEDTSAARSEQVAPRS